MDLKSLTFVCPNRCGTLVWSDTSLSCPECKKDFPVSDGIAVLFSDQLVSKYRHSVDTSQSYYRNAFNEYDETHAVSAPGAGKFTEEFESRLRPYLSHDLTVLEIGSGTGFATNVITKLAGHLVISDASLEMLGINHERHPQHVAVCCPSENLPFPEGSFDLVLGNNTFYLVPDKEKCARQISNVLKKGGRFIISEMNPFQFLWPVRFAFSGQRWFELSVYQLFPWQMKKRFAAADMEIEEVDCYAFAPYFASKRSLKFYGFIERTFGRFKFFRRLLAIRILYVIRKL